MAQEPTLEAQVAVLADQSYRSMKEFEKLEEKIDRKFEDTTTELHRISNVMVRMEAESKSNNRWVGWAVALAIFLAEIALRFVFV